MSEILEDTEESIHYASLSSLITNPLDFQLFSRPPTVLLSDVCSIGVQTIFQ